MFRNKLWQNLLVIIQMSKVVAPSIRNSQFQRIKDGDVAVLFFRDSCPYCKDFKPTWNRVAREMKRRWNRGSLVYDGDVIKSSSDEKESQSENGQSRESRESSQSDQTSEIRFVDPPHIVKVDIVKFPAIKNRMQFPTVPCIALYKRGEPVVFFTSQDRSLPNVLSALENYYIRAQLPPQGEYVMGTQDGAWPQQQEQKVQSQQQEKRDSLDNEKADTYATNGADDADDVDDADDQEDKNDQEYKSNLKNNDQGHVSLKKHFRNRDVAKEEGKMMTSVSRGDYISRGGNVSRGGKISQGAKVSREKTRNEFHMTSKKSHHNDHKRHLDKEHDEGNNHEDKERKSAYEKLRKKEKEHQEKLKREEMKREKLREEIVKREKMLLEERRKVKQVEPDLEELKRRREQSLHVKHQKKFEEAVAASAQKQAQRIIEEERKKRPDEQESFARFLALLLKLKGELK